MLYGPFGTLSEFEGWIEDVCQGEDPLFHAIVNSGTGKATGLASEWADGFIRPAQFVRMVYTSLAR